MLTQLSQVATSDSESRQAPSRLQTVLSSEGPIGIIFSSDMPERTLSAALRIAYDLMLYHKLDSYLVYENEALEMVAADSFKNGNLLYIGKPDSDLVRPILGQKRTAFGINAGRLFINGRDLADPAMSMLA